MAVAAAHEGLRAIQKNDLVEGLINLYQEQILCDTTLEADNEQIKAHRCVLVACSPYFKAMFAFEPCHGEKAIRLQNITGPALRDIVTFLYAGQIDVTDDNVQALLSGANMLQIKPLLNVCIEYMSEAICIENCLSVLMFADFLCVPLLKEKALNCVLENFIDVYQTDNFLLLDVSLLSVILKSDDLNIANEENVFEAIQIWMKHDLETRKKNLFSLLSCIRFSLLHSCYIDKAISQNVLICENDECSDLLKRVSSYKEARQLSPFSTNARLGMLIKDMLIFSGGANSFKDRVFICVDPDTYECYNIEPQHSAGLKFRLDLYRLVVTPKNDIFCMGGVFYSDMQSQRKGVRPSNAILQYDQKSQMWKPKPVMPTGMCGFAVTCFKKEIYAFGGYQYYPSHPPTDETWCYETELEVWTECNKMPFKLALQASVTFNDFAYLFGGKDHTDECLPTVLQFGYATNQWALLESSIPKPISEATALNYEGKIYLLGGSNREGYVVNVFVFHPERQEWDLRTDFPKHRKLLSIVGLKNYIYVCGVVRHVHPRLGFSGRGITVESKEVFRYDIDNDIWSKESKNIENINCYTCNRASVNMKLLTRM